MPPPHQDAGPELQALVREADAVIQEAAANTMRRVVATRRARGHKSRFVTELKAVEALRAWQQKRLELMRRRQRILESTRTLVRARLLIAQPGAPLGSPVAPAAASPKPQASPAATPVVTPPRLHSPRAVRQHPLGSRARTPPLRGGTPIARSRTPSPTPGDAPLFVLTSPLPRTTAAAPATALSSGSPWKADVQPRPRPANNGSKTPSPAKGMPLRRSRSPVAGAKDGGAVLPPLGLMLGTPKGAMFARRSIE